ncbi:hypothetical protein CBR_g20277 [Chara braunii]|uniref:Uncharacterized protein n=1 Tax=Chara braunii TaxID=69332 RepID=A0A388L013_CHABU|nr:hypothetical protein CBR_g20277 [Chara braunii]|eukprot:GBG75650.1 hypothetical protein CBR_g20277 [Chara braunii]
MRNCNTDNESAALCGHDRPELNRWRACGVGWDTGKLIFPGMDRLSFRKRISGPQQQAASHDEEKGASVDSDSAGDNRVLEDSSEKGVKSISMVARQNSSANNGLPLTSGMSPATTPPSATVSSLPSCSDSVPCVSLSRSRVHSSPASQDEESSPLCHQGEDSCPLSPSRSPVREAGGKSPRPRHARSYSGGIACCRGESVGGDEEEGGVRAADGSSEGNSDFRCRQRDCPIAEGEVWEAVLPVDYEEICRAVYPEPLSCEDKRKVYSLLADGVLLHGGFYSYRLMKRQGSARASASVAMSSSSMSIVWGHDIRHWEEVRCPASMFGRVMVLHRVHWFDVSGRISWHFPPGVYTCAWRLSRMVAPKFIENVATFWGSQPAESFVRTSDGQTVRLWLPLSHETVVAQPEWMEWQAGEIVVPEVEGSKLTKMEIDFALRETNFDSVKMGLCVDCFMVYESDPENLSMDGRYRPSGRRVRDGACAVFPEEERPDPGKVMWKLAGERFFAALRYVADPLNSTGLAES